MTYHHRPIIILSCAGIIVLPCGAGKSLVGNMGAFPQAPAVSGDQERVCELIEALTASNLTAAP